MAQWVKNPALSLLWLRFDPWPENFHMLWEGPKKEREGEREREREDDRKRPPQPWPLAPGPALKGNESRPHTCAHTHTRRHAHITSPPAPQARTMCYFGHVRVSQEPASQSGIQNLQDICFQTQRPFHRFLENSAHGFCLARKLLV